MKKKFLAAMVIGIGLLCGLGTVQVRAEEIPQESIMVETPESLMEEEDVSDNSVLYTESSALSKGRTYFTATDIRGGQNRTFDPTNGKYKIIVFGSIPACGYSTATLERMDSVYQYLDTSKVDVFCFDIKRNDAGTIKNYLSSKKISADTFVASKEVNSAVTKLYNDCFYAALNNGQVDSDTFSYTMPLVIYVDGSGNILKTTAGIQSVDQILDNMVGCGIKLLDKPRNGVVNTTVESRSKHVKVQNYVKRLYNMAMEREAESNGLNDWVSKLESGKETGASAAYGFFFSREYINKNVSNEVFLETLYMVMMNRPADEAGEKNWLTLLNEGVSREFVFKGFSESEEFTQICKNYGITRGSIALTENRDRNEGVTRFVSRLYQNALGRNADRIGLNTWCGEICDKRQSVEDVSTKGFFHSREFVNKKVSNEEYIKILYRTFLGREADPVGMRTWTTEMKNGKSRDEILYGFSRSKEFKQIMAKYGL